MEFFSEYLGSIANPDQRTRMKEVLEWTLATFPGLVPKIAWNQPMFTDHGTFIIGFSISRQHLAVAPEIAVINRFSDEILKAGYDHTKMLMRIKWNSPLDFSLLEKIIKYNILDKADCSTFWRK